MSERMPSPSTPKAEAPTAEEYLNTETAHAESAKNLEAKKAEMTQAIESGDFAKVAELAAEAQALESGTATLESKKHAGFDAAYEEAHVENERIDAERASEREQAAREQEKAAKESERMATIDAEITAKRQELDQLKASGNFAGIGEIAKQIISLEAQKSISVEEKEDEDSFAKYESMTDDDFLTMYEETIHKKTTLEKSLNEQWSAKPEVVEINNLKSEMGDKLEKIYFDPNTPEETKKLVNTLLSPTEINSVIARIDTPEYKKHYGEAVQFLREHNILSPETEERIKNLMQEKDSFFQPIENEEEEISKLRDYMNRRDPNLRFKPFSSSRGGYNKFNN